MNPRIVSFTRLKWERREILHLSTVLREKCQITRWLNTIPSNVYSIFRGFIQIRLFSVNESYQFLRCFSSDLFFFFNFKVSSVLSLESIAFWIRKIKQSYKFNSSLREQFLNPIEISLFWILSIRISSLESCYYKMGTNSKIRNIG